MNIYEWQSIDEDAFGADGDHTSLNLSGHFSSSGSTSISRTHCGSSDVSDGVSSHEKLLRELTKLRDRLEGNSERYASVNNLSRLRHRIEKGLLMVEEFLKETPQHHAENALNNPATHQVDMRYLETLVTALENEPNVTKVCASFRVAVSSGGWETVPVDLVSCGGLRWVKVRAASTYSLQNEANKSGWENPITRLLLAAKESKLPFMQVPEVVVLFSCIPPATMADAVRSMGARPVSIAELKVRAAGGPLQALWRRDDFLPPRVSLPKYVCFDTTALVALCSEACFAESVESNVAALRGFRVLAEQQRRDKSDPCVRSHIEPILNQYSRWLDVHVMEKELRGHIQKNGRCSVDNPSVVSVEVSWIQKLVDLTADGESPREPLSESVVVRRMREDQAKRREIGDQNNCLNWIVADVTLAEFRWILETIAGPRELRRALSLLQCCSVVHASSQYVELCDSPITHVSLLASTSKVSQRNLLVFGLGDALRAIVISSNRQILNVALNQGVELMVATHPARALIEQKVRGMSRREGLLAPPPISTGVNV